MSRLRAEWGLYTRKYATQKKKLAVWWYYIYGPDGKRHLLSTGETNKNNAMREVARRIADGSALPQRVIDETQGPTVEEFAAGIWDWESDFIRSKNLKGSVTPRYVREMGGRVKAYILPTLGTRRIKTVGVADLEDLFMTLAETLSPNTVNIISKAARAVWDEAFRRDVIAKNPFDKITQFRAKAERKDILTLDQAFAVLDRRWWADTNLWAINLTAAVTGARVAELCALRVGNVLSDRVWIKETVRLMLGPVEDTKTGEAGKRYAAIPPQVSAVLADLCKGRDPDLFVFRDSRHMAIEDPVKGLNDAIAACNKGLANRRTDPDAKCIDPLPPVKFHGWRHFVKSTLSSRVNSDTVSLHLGHSVHGVQGTYLHQTEDHIQECLGALIAVWGTFQI